ncbi:MAG: hypothetical protein IJY11_03030 [Clostridia bacterium]|nr:hypothetical protein [Clostridia bacterium]
MKELLSKIKAFFCGKNAHAKNAVRYFLIVVAFLMFLFFSNDFDLINIQQSAIVMAIGIDKEEEGFSITSQIAVPSASSSQGEKGSKTVNVVTKGKTVAQALEKVNEKTGWYPKLVFCRLLVLGESATQENVFDCLEYFLRDEYITDGCLLAACDGKAEELLSTQTPIDASGALAIEKVLSNHAERVGASLPNTLRLFAASYFGEAKSGFLPLVKAEPLSPQEQGQGGGSESSSSGQTGQSGQNGEKSGGQSGQESQPEKVFSASETTLFVDGKRIGKLSKEESFLYALVKNQLRLASYTLPYGQETYTMTIKRSSPSVKLEVGKEAKLTVELALTAGVADASQAKDLPDTADEGDFPKPLLQEASKKLEEDIRALFEKCRALGFDLFDAIDKLQKYENEHFEDKKDTLLQEVGLSVKVAVRGIR